MLLIFAVPGWVVPTLWVALGIVSVMLIGIVLLQDSKAGGLSTAFGGGGGDTLLGAHGQKDLAKGTVILVILFFILSITGGVLSKPEYSDTIAQDEEATVKAGAEAGSSDDDATTQGTTGDSPGGSGEPADASTGGNETPKETPKGEGGEAPKGDGG